MKVNVDIPKIIKGLDYTCEDKASSHLLEVSLALSRLCNMQCDYCFTEGGKAREDELSIDERREILDAASSLGAKTWYLAGDGEPLLERNLDAMLEHANSLGMYVVMFTNGTRLNRDRVEQFKKKDLSVLVKWNSLDEQIFNRVTHYGQGVSMVEYDGVNVPKALALFIEGGFTEESPTRLGMETVVMSYNQNDIQRMLEFCANHNVYPHIERILHAGRAVEHPDLFPENQDTLPAHIATDICSQRKHYSMYIRSDGESYICFGGGKELSLGSVRKYPLDELVERRDQQLQNLMEQYGPVGCLCTAVLDVKNDRS